METLNRFDREALQRIFARLCEQNGALWSCSVLRPLRRADGAPPQHIGQVSDRALLAIVAEFRLNAGPGEGLKLAGAK